MVAEESTIGQGFLCGINGSQSHIIPGEQPGTLAFMRRGGHVVFASAQHSEEGTMVKVDQADESL